MMLLVAGGVFGPSVKAQNWTGATIDAAKDKTVYLWNVGAKQFLGKGGRWGTEAVVSNVGTPFKVTSSGSGYLLESVVKGQGSTDSGCLGFMNGVNSGHDAGNYFVDRTSADGNTRVLTFSGSAEGYQLQVTSSQGTSDYIGTFYLFANMAGDKKAKGVKSAPADSTAFSQWIIVTEDERKTMFEKAEASSASAVPATFLMFDNGFDRNDNNVVNWKTSSASGKGLDGTLSWNNNGSLDKKGDFWLPSDAYPSTVTTTTYTYTYTGSHTYTSWFNTYTHNVTHTVTTTTPPTEQAKTLTISCGGGNDRHNATNVTVTLDEAKTVSNTETKTYAGYTYYNGNGYVEGNMAKVDEDGKELPEESHEMELYGGDWTANIHGSYGVVNQTIPNENMVREGWYKVSCVGFTTATTGTAQLYVASGEGKDEAKYYAVQALKTIDATNAPTTYVKASRLINGGGYEASAMVYIDKNTAGKLKTLSFGIMVDGADETAWTCFDDFQIEYLGMPKTELVLDEEQTDVDYINKQTTAEGQANEKRTLYLHRTVNKDVWNSIVLPVSLTVSQAQSAFGDNFKLSEFKGAINKDIPGRMYFEAVNINRNNKDAVAIEAGKLYIMKPENEEPSKQEEKIFDATGDKKYTSYFMIPGVTFNDKRENIIAKVEGEKGDETFGEATQVQFVGTYVANKTNEKLIPAKSYVLRGNKDGETGLWFYRTAETSTKGFRGWLQTVESTNTSKISFSINGVVDDSETTGIDAIGAELNGNAVNGNIYNLSGQLVRRNATSLEGLAKGVYIHNGKKYIVK